MYFLVTVGALIAAVVALNRIGTLSIQLRKQREVTASLRADLSFLKDIVARIEQRFLADPEPSTAPAPVKGRTRKSESKAAAIAAAKTVSEPAEDIQETTPPIPETVAAVQSPPDSEASGADMASDAATPAGTSGTQGFRSIEQALAGRWFVVLGGIAIALGGLLFIKYAHDNGLLPPIFRVIFGYIFAAALVGSGEYVRRKRMPQLKDYVPAALSAAGILIAFAVTYASYALYGLFSPGLCFPVLAAIGLGALWLSRLQGPLIAALGLIGAYAAPALVPSDNPSAIGFFGYLVVIVTASFFELRSRPWWWLGYAAIAGALVWSLLWIYGGLFNIADLWPIALFAFSLAGISAFLPRGLAFFTDDTGTLAEPQLAGQGVLLAAAGTLAGSAILASLVVATRHGTQALTAFSLAMIGIAAFGWFKPHRNVAAGLAAIITFITFSAWPDVSTLNWAFDDRGFWTIVPQFIEPPRFVAWMFAAWVGFTLLGIAGLVRKADLRYWDVLAALSAVAFLLAAWIRADFTIANSLWGLMGLGGTVMLASAALAVQQKQSDVFRDNAIFALLAAVATLALFAADRFFDGVAYTLSIAGLAAAFAYSKRYFGLVNAGLIAVALATLTALRLFVAREFFTETTTIVLGAHWPLYGYGIPAALFWWASRELKNETQPRFQVSLEGISIGLLVALVSIELRVLIGGGVTSQTISFLEMGSHATAWLAAAYGLAWRQQVYSGLVSRVATIGLTALASLVVICLLTVLNPVLTGEPLEGGALVNALWLAYLMPAVLLGLIVNRPGRLSDPPQRQVLAATAMIAGLAFLTLTVKRWYQGAYMIPEFSSHAENYTVSAMWLFTGVLAFAAGLVLNRWHVRLGGLVLLVLTVLKVFVLDLAGLEGLWRIASLMGLGFSLVGIGWLYTRFTKLPGKPEPA
jgi:uncharacterized membrane protein